MRTKFMPGGQALLLVGAAVALVAVPAAQARHARRGRISRRAPVVLRRVRGRVSVNGVRLKRVSRVPFGAVVNTKRGVVQVAIQGKVAPVTTSVERISAA